MEVRAGTYNWKTSAIRRPGNKRTSLNTATSREFHSIHSLLTVFTLMCLLWAHVLLFRLRCPALHPLLRHICKHYYSTVVHLLFLFIVVWKCFFCLLLFCHSFVQGETLAPLAVPHPSREMLTPNSFAQRRTGEQSRYCAPPKNEGVVALYTGRQFSFLAESLSCA